MRLMSECSHSSALRCVAATGTDHPSCTMCARPHVNYKLNISFPNFISKSTDLFIMAGAVDPLAPLEGIDFLLNEIGFNLAEQRGRIMEAGLAEYEDFRYLVEKDIRDMAEEFGKRTQPNGRIIFGLGRIKKLTGVMHWVQD